MKIQQPLGQYLKVTPEVLQAVLQQYTRQVEPCMLYLEADVAGGGYTRKVREGYYK